MENQMYYCNVPCTVKADIGDKAVIEVAVDFDVYYENDTGYEEITPEFRTIVVDKKYLSDKKISIEQLRDVEIRKAQEECRKIIREANSEARSIIGNAKENLQVIEDRLKKVGGLSPYLDYLDDNIEWVLCKYKYCKDDEFDYHIIPISEFEEKERESNYGLRAYILEKNKFGDDAKVKIMLSDYSDYSGSTMYEVILFKTFEELKHHVLGILDNCSKITGRGVSSLKKYNISHTIVEIFYNEKKDREEKNKKEKIERLERELKEAKET